MYSWKNSVLLTLVLVLGFAIPVRTQDKSAVAA